MHSTESESKTSLSDDKWIQAKTEVIGGAFRCLLKNIAASVIGIMFLSGACADRATSTPH